MKEADRKLVSDLLLAEYAYWRNCEIEEIDQFCMGAMGAISNVLAAVLFNKSPEQYRASVAARNTEPGAGALLTPALAEPKEAAALFGPLFAEILKQNFPWLGTEEEAEGADTVQALGELYDALNTGEPGGLDQCTHPDVSDGEACQAPAFAILKGGPRCGIHARRELLRDSKSVSVEDVLL